ncbi:MAG: restriction endonuclease subunit S [Phycisphaerae bacterium]
MGSEPWVNMPFDEAVQVNPPVALKRGEVYPFVDMQAVIPASRSVGPSETREFDGGGSHFAPGDTLMARITPCLENGKIARFRPQGDHQVGHGSTEFIVIRGRPGVTDNDFAYYLTKWDGVRLYCVSQMTGSSGRQRVPISALSHCEVPVPPLGEQKRIAGILGTLDDKIELNRRMNETLEAMARAIFKSWFVDFDPVRAKVAGRKPPSMDAATAALFPAAFQDSPIGPIPKGWQAVGLEQYVEAVKGLSYNGAGLAQAGEGLPLHNLNSVLEGGGYKYAGIKYYTGEYRERHFVRPGDVIVANTEQGFDYLLIGYPAIVPACFGESGLFSHHLYRVRPVSKSPLKTQFLYHLLMSPLVRDQITGCTNGTTVNMLAADGLQRPLFVLPPAGLIDRFESLAADLHAKAECNRQESETLTAMRDALLPRLLSGEIRVQDAGKSSKGVA